MSNSDDLTASFRTLNETVKAGFLTVVSAIGETNQRIDQTNARLDQTNGRVDSLHADMNERLDQTNRRLDALREDMNERFDGVSVYLRSINGSILGHSERIHKLEERVQHLEDQHGST